MALIAQFAEGCIKPRLHFLFGFAKFLNNGAYPTQSQDFGSYIANWPLRLAPKLKSLFYDPIFRVPINQWRNIAAHKDYRQIGANIFELHFGKTNPTTCQFTFEQLELVLVWAKGLLSVCRMAEVIISIEFMPELKQAGLQNPIIRFDAWMIGLSHNLRMVGFTYISELQDGGELKIMFSDDLQRSPRDAIIHLSQALTQIALAVSSDVGLQDNVTTVGVALCTKDEKEYASAQVSVDIALQHMNRNLTQKQYIYEIEFSFAEEVGQE